MTSIADFAPVILPDSSHDPVTLIFYLFSSFSKALGIVNNEVGQCYCSSLVSQVEKLRIKLLGQGHTIACGWVGQLCVQPPSSYDLEYLMSYRGESPLRPGRTYLSPC